MTHKPVSSAKVCFIGSNSLLSLATLQQLYKQKINVAQIILAGYGAATHSESKLPTTIANKTEQAITHIHQIACSSGIPMTYLGQAEDHYAQWQRLCSDERPDYVLVACFPKILPASLIQWPRVTSMNLHPSLLPKYRGPDPIFWQLRFNERHTGVTLHQLSEALDAGPILGQQTINLPQDASNAELTRLFAQQGAELFISLLHRESLDATAQDPEQSSYDPLPTADDYVIDPNWSVEHAYRFMRGTPTPAGGYPITLHKQTLYLHSALSYSKQPAHSLQEQQMNDVIAIPFADGVLCAKSV